jgi:hypothetical protein
MDKILNKLAARYLQAQEKPVLMAEMKIDGMAPTLQLWCRPGMNPYWVYVRGTTPYALTALPFKEGVRAAEAARNLGNLKRSSSRAADDYMEAVEALLKPGAVLRGTAFAYSCP